MGAPAMTRADGHQGGGNVITIRLRRNGPYVIDSEDVRVVDWNGQQYTVERWPIALCRCGASATKPFCDRSHSRIGFEAAEQAVGEAAKDERAK